MIVIKRLIVSILIYAFIVLIIFATKPAIIFDANGRPKDFGVGLTEGRSVFGLAILLPVFAVVSYIIACTIQIAIV